MNLLIAPVVIAAVAAAISALAALYDEDASRSVAVVGLLGAAVAAALAVARAASGESFGALEPGAIGSGAAAIAAAGTAHGLARAPLSAADRFLPALGTVGVAGAAAAAQSRWVAPTVLYLAIPVASLIAGRWRRPATAAAVAVTAAVLTAALVAWRGGTGFWGLPGSAGWDRALAPPGTGAAVLALVCCAALLVLATLAATSRSARLDAYGMALGWPVLAAATAIALSIAPAVADAAGGAAPGAIVVLALAVVFGFAGAEAAPVHAGLLTLGVALAPGVGAGAALVVGGGVFLGTILEGAGGPVGLYGRWSRAGLPGGAAFPGVVVAIVSVVRGPAPAPARAGMAVLVAGAALAALTGSRAAADERSENDSSNPIAAPVAATSALAGIGCLWLALAPDPWVRLAPPAAAAVGDLTPAALPVFGASLGLIAVFALVVFGALHLERERASTTVGVVGAAASARAAAGLPRWRRQVAVALSRVSVPKRITFGIAGVSFVVCLVVAARLVDEGVRAGFL